MFVKSLVFSILAATAIPGGGAAGDLVLRINLPSYELEVWDGDERIRAYSATIGAPAFPTPTGHFTIHRIEWNPSWTPPDSPWARGKDKVGPGPSNPMGRVKLQFDDLLYVHGSSRTDQLGGAHSHGCIRLSNEDALDLARLLALRTGALGEDEIAALEKSPRRTRSVVVPGGVPIMIRYGVTEEVEGEVVELEDVYRWNPPAREEARAPAAPSAAGFLLAMDSLQTGGGQTAPAPTSLQDGVR